MRLASHCFLLAGLLAAALAVAPFTELHAGQPEVLEVEIEPAGVDGDMRFFTFKVTIRHDDEGWDHYANRFEVLDAATGKLLGVRELAHPHENEQPFTRSLYRVPVPQGVTRVHVRSHDSVHGYENPPMELQLPAGS